MPSGSMDTKEAGTRAKTAKHPLLGEGVRPH